MRLVNLVLHGKIRAPRLLRDQGRMHWKCPQGGHCYMTASGHVMLVGFVNTGKAQAWFLEVLLKLRIGVGAVLVAPRIVNAVVVTKVKLHRSLADLAQRDPGHWQYEPSRFLGAVVRVKPSVRSKAIVFGNGNVCIVGIKSRTDAEAALADLTDMTHE